MPLAVSEADVQTLPQSGPLVYWVFTASVRLLWAHMDCRAHVPVTSPPQAVNVAVQMLANCVPEPLPVPPVPASFESVRSKQAGSHRHRSNALTTATLRFPNTLVGMVIGTGRILTTVQIVRIR